MEKKRTTALLLIGVAILATIVLWSSISYTINTGEKGVIFRTFSGGLDKEKVYPQGFHLKWPWDKVFVYDVKIMEANGSMEVLSKNGLTISVDTSACD